MFFYFKYCHSQTYDNVVDIVDKYNGLQSRINNLKNPQFVTPQAK